MDSLKLTFHTTLKSNRLVSPGKEEGYVHLNDIDWTPERLKTGVTVKLKKVPFKAKLSELAATNGDIGWLITNGLDGNLTVQVAQKANGVRWQAGQSHRNHLACCYHAWVSLKVKAKALKTTLYQIRKVT